MNRDFFLHNDNFQSIEKAFCKEGWVTVFQRDYKKDNDSLLIYCCIVSDKRFQQYKEDSNWEIQVGSEGKPAVFGLNKLTYKTYSEKGIEPFIFLRSFHLSNGGNVEYINISEEFVLYFNLLELGDKQNRKYYYVNELGEKEEVIRIEPDLITVKLRFIKEYISLRKFHFVVCYDFMRLSTENLSHFEIEPATTLNKTENYCYAHFLRDEPFVGEIKSQSSIHGKSFIHPEKKIKTHHNSYLYEEKIAFQTGYDEDGEPKLEVWKDKPEQQFKVVYFNKDVLNKYFNEPTKYNVDSFYVRSAFFSLRIDNNVKDYVVVFLKDLHGLPSKEQLHWKIFNIEPQEGVSQAFYKTMIEGEWNEYPQAVDLFFKHRFVEVNKKWEEKYGWKLYKPLSNEDKFLFDGLHHPTSENVKSFCDQMQALVKIILDRLNEQEMVKYITDPKGLKGIGKLEKFLDVHDLSFPRMIEYLKLLWHLRSGFLAHSFSKSNKDVVRAMEHFGVKPGNYVEAARTIFEGAIFTLNTLDKYLIAKKDS